MLIFNELSDKLGTKLFSRDKFSFFDSFKGFLSSECLAVLFSSLIFLRGGVDVEVVGSVEVSDIRSRRESKDKRLESQFLSFPPDVTDERETMTDFFLTGVWSY